MSSNYWLMKSIFSPNPILYADDTNDGSSFRYRGKYHSSNPQVEHRYAGYRPFLYPNKLPDLEVRTFPMCFQNSCIHHNCRQCHDVLHAGAYSGRDNDRSRNSPALLQPGIKKTTPRPSKADHKAFFDPELPRRPDFLGGFRGEQHGG